ncbi:hypothetical protein AB0C52_22675 [Streptomyces sp. NPDC048717]|uniref:hypothetical protein n=1 Tax=Streptomyces sp. NPDC048717 TaxID=3154928 RepID=UPI003433677D
MRARRHRVRGVVPAVALLAGIAGLAVAADLHTAPDPPVRVRVTDPAGPGAVPVAETRGGAGIGAGPGAGGSARGSGAGTGSAEEEERDGAGTSGTREDAGPSCRLLLRGSVVTAHCSNPDPYADRVRLHLECDRWWDVDSDSAPVDVEPADFAQVTGRCWKEVRWAWVTHEPVTAGPGRPESPEPGEAGESAAPPRAMPPAGSPRPSGHAGT